jgi:hypothetical protein
VSGRTTSPGRARIGIAAAAAVLALTGAGSARAGTPAPLASIGEGTVSSAGGVVAWLRPTRSSGQVPARIVALQNGRIADLPIASLAGERGVQNLDVGVSAGGTPVAVYARCGGGCHLFQYDFARRRETHIPIGLGRCDLDAPSYDRGSVAFVALKRAPGCRPGLYVKSATGRPRRLDGSLPVRTDLQDGYLATEERRSSKAADHPEILVDVTITLRLRRIGQRPAKLASSSCEYGRANGAPWSQDTCVEVGSPMLAAGFVYWAVNQYATNQEPTPHFSQARRRRVGGGAQTAVTLHTQPPGTVVPGFAWDVALAVDGSSLFGLELRTPSSSRNGSIVRLGQTTADFR